MTCRSSSTSLGTLERVRLRCRCKAVAPNARYAIYLPTISSSAEAVRVYEEGRLRCEDIGECAANVDTELSGLAGIAVTSPGVYSQCDRHAQQHGHDKDNVLRCFAPAVRPSLHLSECAVKAITLERPNPGVSTSNSMSKSTWGIAIDLRVLLTATIGQSLSPSLQVPLRHVLRFAAAAASCGGTCRDRGRRS